MSIKNFESSGIKNQSIIVDNLTVSVDAIVENDLTVNGDATVAGNVDFTGDNSTQFNIPNGQSLVMTGGNIEVSGGQILSSAQTIPGSVGKILIGEETLTWASGATNTFSIPLDGNNRIGYIMHFQFKISGSGGDPNLEYTFNNITTSSYFNSEIGSQTTGGNNQTQQTKGWVIRNNNSSNAEIQGAGTYNFWVGSQQNLFPSFCGQYYWRTTGNLSSNPEVVQLASGYQVAGTNITSMNIAPSGGNHTGCEFTYRIYTYA